MKKYVNWLIGGIIVLGLAWASIELGKINPVLEFPFWAVILGLCVGSLFRLPERFKVAALTEPYVKTGLILLGATINLAMILDIGSRAVLQVLIGVPLVFFFTIWMAKIFKLDTKLAAIIATAVSICGVSAAIASGSSIAAKKEQMAYVVSLIILFALPFMFFQPYVANLIDLSPAVAGSWIGNNIDNTAAVVGAGKLHSEGAMKVASVVKMTQNSLIGIVVFLLALYFSFKEKTKNISVKVSDIWNKFPKFVLGFILMSVLVTVGYIGKPLITEWINPLRIWLFSMAFVSIGLTVSFKDIRALGGKPFYVFLIATTFNLVTALALALIFFSNYTI